MRLPTLHSFVYFQGKGKHMAPNPLLLTPGKAGLPLGMPGSLGQTKKQAQGSSMALHWLFPHSELKFPQLEMLFPQP